MGVFYFKSENFKELCGLFFFFFNHTELDLESCKHQHQVTWQSNCSGRSPSGSRETSVLFLCLLDVTALWEIPICRVIGVRSFATVWDCWDCEVQMTVSSGVTRALWTVLSWLQLAVSSPGLSEWCRVSIVRSRFCTHILYPHLSTFGHSVMASLSNIFLFNSLS